MIKYSKEAGLLVLTFTFIIACSSQEKIETNHEQNRETDSEEITTLPMYRLPLQNLQEFRSPGDNWSIAGNVQSDYQADYSMEVQNGAGVLVNTPSDIARENLFTELEHGDIELKIEFLVPKSSNSGIYFQGRYEAQILDSWRVENPQFSDVGGIYQRWDESQPDGEKGYEGKAPNVNASLAPGLWQEYHILFRAPRFDEEGNKVENARFEWVYLNDVLVQKDVEVSGPTRAAAFEDEVEKAPLMIQGDHGPVAFRNMEYKLYQQSDSLRLGELDFTVYDFEGDRTPVDFEGLEVLEQGVTDSLNVEKVSPKNEHYATTFSGELDVPVSGDYLFQSVMSNGGNVYINGDLILENTGEFDNWQPTAIINLSEGTHQLDVTHFQIKWGTSLILLYEGPGMEKRALSSAGYDNGGDEAEEPVTVQPLTNEPELIGGFVNYGGEKRTHTLSVGHPEGIHYSYDLNNASLLTFWRSPFADVSQMWRGRGGEQLLVPMNAAVEDRAGVPILYSGTGNDDPSSAGNKFEVDEYRLDEKGLPVFTSVHNGITITDQLSPSEERTELNRTLLFSAEESNDGTSARLAQANTIERLEDDFYRIGGRYYLRILNSGGEEPVLTEYENNQVLYVPILRRSNHSDVQYQLIW